ncbi:MAG TPA: sigma-70 family RNA polymerase sigma factor [Ignavibacteria bacterium]|nr:sigma-70 family RNA polymerase sigma factor [Ignavibacteria bacterium]HMQ99118.1 sigma-70 family RNA polymerase sigma factor [Ignavibacteria bacterium]
MSKQQVESCMNDLELNIIKKIQAGKIEEFEEIVNRYKDRAMTLAMRILKNSEDAEDALQEAFIKTFRAIADKQFEERSKFSTYFYRIVYNTAIDFYKKHKAKTYNLINIDDTKRNDEGEVTDINSFEMSIDRDKYHMSGVYDTDRMTLDNQMQEVVNRYLEEIPEKYSTILTLFYVNDLSHEEIAETLKLPLGTVKNRIFRAKDKLKEVLMKKYSETEILELI